MLGDQAMLAEPMRHQLATQRQAPERNSLRTALVAGAIAVAAVVCSTSRAVEAAGPAPANCINQLTSGSSPEVICSYPTQLGEKERAELRRMTGDLFVDARCLVNIRIERRQITAALIKPDFVFQATPQSVTCDVIGRDEKLPISATFAPRIVLKGGRAVDAHPGMANLSGLNDMLADPLLQYINQSDAIRAQMVKMVNMYIANQQIGAQAFRDRG
jgi:hypothetical protein